MYCTKLMYFLYLLGVNNCYGYGYYGYGLPCVIDLNIRAAPLTPVN